MTLMGQMMHSCLSLDEVAAEIVTMTISHYWMTRQCLRLNCMARCSREMIAQAIFLQRGVERQPWGLWSEGDAIMMLYQAWMCLVVLAGKIRAGHDAEPDDHECQ